jgi:beta-phosphoglucomutase-like phosphatase (HAD superfamily)
LNSPVEQRVVLEARRFRAALFDLDGVITQTARVHAAAWKCLFDDFLRERAARDGTAFEPCDSIVDYQRYVDGKPRYDGVRWFLAARDIELPFGRADEAPGSGTVCSLGNCKDALFHQQLARHGAATHASSVHTVCDLRAAGLGIAVVSASRNCRSILQAALPSLTKLPQLTVDEDCPGTHHNGACGGTFWGVRVSPAYGF